MQGFEGKKKTTLHAFVFPFLNTPFILGESPVIAIGARARFEPNRDGWKVHMSTT